MHVVQPYAKLVNFMGLPPSERKLDYTRWRPYGIDAMRFIEETGRKCYRSEGGMSFTSWEQFIKTHIFGNRHTQMLRFSLIVVDFMVDRGIATEIIRHGATMTPQHESQRYCNYSKGKFGSSVGFIKPHGLSPSQENVWTIAMEFAETSYLRLLSEGCKPQIAADALPRATASLLTLCGNFQAWRHFMLVRSTKVCHPKMLNVTVEDCLYNQETGESIGDGETFNCPTELHTGLLTQFQTVFPILFDDIEPFSDHVENMKKVR